MTRKERYEGITGWFQANMPEAKSELDYMNGYELLVAVILSAQCTDKRVNMVTPAFFKRFPDAVSLAGADFDEVLRLISSISFPNNKARHLIGMARMLTERFGGIIPEDVETMQQLPGVGRKTANVVASIIYRKPVIAVDTHVFRVARRIGLSDGKTVEAVEADLTAGFPERLRADAHHWLILHGRYGGISRLAQMRKPECTVVHEDFRIKRNAEITLLGRPLKPLSLLFLTIRF